MHYRNHWPTEWRLSRLSSPNLPIWKEQWRKHKRHKLCCLHCLHHHIRQNLYTNWQPENRSHIRLVLQKYDLYCRNHSGSIPTHRQTNSRWRKCWIRRSYILVWGQVLWCLSLQTLHCPMHSTKILCKIQIELVGYLHYPNLVRAIYTHWPGRHWCLFQYFLVQCWLWVLLLTCPIATLLF